MIPPAEVKELTLKDYFDLLQKHLLLIGTICLVAVGVVTFRSFSSPKIYLAKTTIVIESEKPKIAEQIEELYKIAPGKDYYQTQVDILTSRSLAERILKKIGLDKDPEFMHSAEPVEQLLSMVKVEPVKVGNIVTISVEGKDPIKITSIANTWAREFIYQDVERKIGTAKYGVSFLESQMSDILVKLREAEKDLNNFIRENKIVTIPDIETKAEALIENLKSQKAQLEKEIAEASQKYKEKHPTMISLNTQLKNVESKLEEEINTRLTLQEKMAEYGVLKRKVDTYKSLYDEFLKRARELDVSKELNLSNIRVIDPAQEPKSPIRPKPAQDIAMAAIVSLIASIGLALLIEYMDSSIKTSDDVEFYVKMPFLGYIPRIEKKLIKNTEANLISHIDPRSRITESFRNLKVSLLFSSVQEKTFRSVVVTSSIPGEGKSFVSSNLAIVFAQANEPTLLIDADIRKGNLYQSFGIKSRNGLTTLLTGGCSLEEAVSPTTIPNLSILPAGPYSPNPTELLSSEKLVNFLQELGKKFKRIVIDSTPVLNVSEAIILAGMSDGLIFTIRSGYTSIKYILEAKKIIDKRVKIIGAVLNDTDMGRDRYYYYHYYYPQAKK